MTFFLYMVRKLSYIAYLLVELLFIYIKRMYYIIPLGTDVIPEELALFNN